MKKWKIPALAALACAAVLAAVLFGIPCPKNAVIGGWKVGGKTPWELYTQLRNSEKALQAHELTISLPEADITLNPEVRFHKLTMVISAFREDYTPVAASYSRKDVLSRLEAYAAQYDTAYFPSGYHLEGDAPDLSTRSFDGKTQTLVLDPGVPERKLNYDGVFSALDGMYETLFLQQDYRVTVDVPAQKEPDKLDLDAIHAELSSQPVDDALDMETYGEIPGSYGYSFDLDKAKTMLKDKPISVPMVATPPEIMGENLYFRDVLGHCETKHTDDENRNTNLRLVCQALDGLVLQPGEEFSYNGSVGERTEEKGYKPAGAYSGTRLVKDIGGGVCQGSTTLYNCALLADLEIIERNGHGFTVNYVPIGLDAAVNWATKTDLQFRNNWNFPIMIQAEVSDGYMRMKLLGTDEKDYYIEMTSTYSEEELRIYSRSYKNKYDKLTGEKISKEAEALSSYMYMN